MIDDELIYLKKAFFKAGSLDVKVIKPGNVFMQSPGHGMLAKQFIESLEAIIPLLFDSHYTLGQKIEYSVNASFEVAKCNTNLGIILLCAPIIEALLKVQKNNVKSEVNYASNFESFLINLRRTLKNSSVEDTQAVFRAIKKANPGGLGENEFADVRFETDRHLLEAMKLGAKKDFIAKQYITFYEDIFNQEIILSIRKNNLNKEKLIRGISCKNDLDKFVQKIYFNWLIMFLDSHISRKFGENLAKAVNNEARNFLLDKKFIEVDSKIKNVNIREPSEKQLLYWDYSLKMRKINPGTSADLTVCTLFLAYVFMPDLGYF